MFYSEKLQSSYILCASFLVYVEISFIVGSVLQ